MNSWPVLYVDAFARLIALISSVFLFFQWNNYKDVGELLHSEAICFNIFGNYSKAEGCNFF